MPLPEPTSSFNFHFTPDGKVGAFVRERKGVDNIWIQPMDAAKARQLTNYKSEAIQDFRWSPNGKQLAVLRVDHNDDVILPSRHWDICAIIRRPTSRRMSHRSPHGQAGQTAVALKLYLH
ncbi:MAG: hypothetical protein WBQ08_14640 [Candidatus Sulfotelmatobacter sp.]